MMVMTRYCSSMENISQQYRDAYHPLMPDLAMPLELTGSLLSLSRLSSVSTSHFNSVVVCGSCVPIQRRFSSQPLWRRVVTRSIQLTTELSGNCVRLFTGAFQCLHRSLNALLRRIPHGFRASISLDLSIVTQSSRPSRSRTRRGRNLRGNGALRCRTRSHGRPPPYAF